MAEGKRNKCRALLVFGAPCSGKSTFAKKFADRFGLIFLDLNKFSRENELSRKALLAVVELLASTKQSLVLEGGTDTEKDRRELKRILRYAGYSPSLIWVQTDIPTLRNRLKSKYKDVAKAKETYETAVNEIEAPSASERPIIISGKHTFETQAKHVITGLASFIV